MANVIKEKIREILSHVNVSNGQAMETDSGSTVSEGDLVELKNLIKTAPSSDLTSIIEDQDLSPLFKLLTESFLQTKDHEAARDVMDIFGTLLNGLPAVYISTHLRNELLDGLTSPSELINEIWLKTLERLIGNQTALENLISKETNPILIPIINLLKVESVSNAKIASNCLLATCSNGFLDKVFQESNVDQMKQLISINDISKTRILSFMIQVSNIDEKCLKKVFDCGFLSLIVADAFNASDPLLSLNCLQLLTELSKSVHGMDFLSSSSTSSQVSPLDKVTSMIVKSDFPLSDLLLPGYLTLFASIASNRPVIVSKYQNAMDTILAYFPGGIPNKTPTVATCFDVLGSIGTTSEGKVALNSCPGMKQFLSSIGSVISGSSGDLKLSAMRSLSLLLSMDGSDLNGHEVTMVIESWYKQLSPVEGSVTKALFTMAQEPFLDHRLGSLEVIRVLSLHQFGQKELLGLSSGQSTTTNSLPGGHASFIEYLITRGTEFSKEGKESKFAIVSELIISPFTISVFGRGNYMKLKQYFKEGPFFVSTQSYEPQVAIRND